MHWFHHVAEMGRVTLLWAGSFLVFLGGSWLLTRKSRHLHPWAPQRSPGTGPQFTSSPKPST